MESFAGKDHVLVFGSVLDPKGAYGVGIIEAENEGFLPEFTGK